MTDTLRRIDESEVEDYRALVQSAYVQATTLGVHFAASDGSMDDFRRHLRENVAWGLEEDGALVATASIRFPWGPNPGRFSLPHLGWVATDPAVGRQGWGRRVIDAVIALLAREVHAPAVSLGTAKDHPFLASYYTGQGFLPAGEADLGIGHVTSYFIKPIDPPAFRRWLTQNPSVSIQGVIA